ncbi:MAG: alpha/beta hydrolase [Saprospiraceae bacterium]|nr:alpha/beta hydrolase [Saprospiraceae bacterium]
MASIRKLETSGGRVNCRVWGNGPATLIALHGYGDSGLFYEKLAEVLSGRYRLWAPDLPFHGETSWQTAHFGPPAIAELLEAVLREEESGAFDLLGFSWGARLAAGQLLADGPRPECLLLAAPDGFQTNGMRIPDAVPASVRKALSDFILSFPGAVLRGGRLLEKLKIIPPSAGLFLRSNLRRASRRKRVLAAWRSTAGFPGNRRDWRRALDKCECRVEVLLGSKDPLVNEETVRRTLEDLPDVRIRSREGGHKLDIEAIEEILNESGQTGSEGIKP